MLGIRRTRVYDEHQRLILIMAAIVAVAESAVMILSLGFFTSDWHANFIMSEFYERHADLR